MFVLDIALRMGIENISSVESLASFIAFYPLRLKLFKMKAVRLWLMFKFAEVPASLLKFNVAAFFSLAIQILVDLALRQKTDIAWQQVLGQVSQTMKVSDSETLGNSLFLSVSKFIKH